MSTHTRFSSRSDQLNSAQSWRITGTRFAVGFSGSARHRVAITLHSSARATSHRVVDVSMPRIRRGGDLDTIEGSKLHSPLTFWTAHMAILGAGSVPTVLSGRC